MIAPDITTGITADAILSGGRSAERSGGRGHAAGVVVGRKAAVMPPQASAFAEPIRVVLGGQEHTLTGEIQARALACRV